MSANAQFSDCSDAYLDEVLAFWLRDQRLEFGSGKGVDESGFGHNEQKDLGASKDRQFVSLAVYDSCQYTNN